MKYYKVWLHPCSEDCDVDTEFDTYLTIVGAIEDLHETMNGGVCEDCGNIRVELSEHWVDKDFDRKEKTLFYYNKRISNE